MQVLIEVPDRWGRTSAAEVVVRLDTVEIRYQDRLIGVADRDRLRDWLRDPHGSYVYDEICWLAVSIGVSLALEDEPAWVLPDHILFRLREHL